MGEHTQAVLCDWTTVTQSEKQPSYKQAEGGVEKKDHQTQLLGSVLFTNLHLARPC